MARTEEETFFMNGIIQEDMEHMYKSKIVDWESFRNKTILVTGAYGVIASYLIFMLIYLNELDKGYNINIIALGRDKKKIEKRFSKYSNKEYFTTYIGDVTSVINIENIKVNYIVHAASPAGTQHFIENPVGVIIPNTIGTYNLLEYARVNKLDGFLFMSSTSIYGTNLGLNGITEQDYGVVDPLNMRSCYVESKRMGEQMCNAYSRQYGIHTKIVRISHTYGPTLDIVNDKRIIAKFCRNILASEDIVLFKDESTKVQYSYIADIILGCFKVLLDGKDGEAYNICSDEFLPMHEIAEVLVSAFPDKKLKVNYKEITNEYAFGQNQGINNSECDNQKLKDLGWTVKYPLASGFKRTIEGMI